jgi:hypothetical protein
LSASDTAYSELLNLLSGQRNPGMGSLYVLIRWGTFRSADPGGGDADYRPVGVKILVF